MDAFLLYLLTLALGHRNHKDDNSDFLDDIPIWALKVFAIIFVPSDQPLNVKPSRVRPDPDATVKV